MLVPLESASNTDLDAITLVSNVVRNAIRAAQLETDLLDAIRNAHQRLESDAVSVRSSATTEGMADASFAGQYESFLNILGFDEIVLCIRDVWASLYSPCAIAYRLQTGFDHGAVRMAVVVQKQLQPDAAGVLFTRDPVTGARRFVASASLGLGEGVVTGEAPTDQFQIDPDTGAAISSHIVSKNAKYLCHPVELNVQRFQRRLVGNPPSRTRISRSCGRWPVAWRTCSADLRTLNSPSPITPSTSSSPDP